MKPLAQFARLTRSPKPHGAAADAEVDVIDGGRHQGESDNPYLSARRTWNDHMGAVIAARRHWQLLCILSLLIALASVGGIIHIGSQSKFIPYLVKVDKLGQAVAVAPAHRTSVNDQSVISASMASFVHDIRLVTPDVALQRRAIFHVYSMLSANDAATAKANEWLNGSEDSSPFKRAATETTSIEIESALPHTVDTWQVDWIETVRDRQGSLKGKPIRMRALISVYTMPTTPQTTEEQIRNNPLGIYVRDFSWSKQL